MKWKIWPVSKRKESEIKKKDKDKRDVKEDWMKKKNKNSTFPVWAQKVLGTESWILKRGTNWVGEGTCCTKKNLTKLYLVGKAPMSGGPY
jgi:hypothetical protein